MQKSLLKTITSVRIKSLNSFILLIHIDRYIIYIPINIYIHISVLYTYYTKDIHKIYTKTSQSMFK